MRSMNPSNLNQFVEQLRALLPVPPNFAQEELKANLKVFLESAFARMNLVTREEFDAQAALLARARERLETLEAALSELEKRS